MCLCMCCMRLDLFSFKNIYASMTIIALVHMSLDVLAESGYLNKCQHPGGAFNVVSSAKVAANLGYTARLTKAGGAESVMNKHSTTTNSESMTHRSWKC